MKKRLWVRRVVQIIAVANVMFMCGVGMIFGHRWGYIASTACWFALFSIQHFYKADLKIEPAPMSTRILDI